MDYAHQLVIKVIIISISAWICSNTQISTANNEIELFNTKKQAFMKDFHSKWLTQVDQGPRFDLQGALNEHLFGICNPQYESTNWLMTPFINAEEAESLAIELVYSIKSCSQMKRARYCKESFQLFAWESNYPRSGPIDFNRLVSGTIKPVTTIASMTNGNSKAPNNVSISYHIKQRGVHLVFKDTGACIGIHKLRVFYRVCPKIVHNLAEFGLSLTKDIHNIVPVSGKCVPGARPISDGGGRTIEMMCQSNGQWHLSDRKFCECKPGFEQLTNERCSECPGSHFKKSAGPGKCQKCPEKSTSEFPGSESCECFPGFFRSSKLDNLSSPCTSPPSAPLNLRKNFLQDNAVVELKWDPPVDLGGRRDVSYHVECENCPPFLVYKPTATLTETSVRVEGLQSKKSYKFIVYSRNGVSKISNTLKERKASIIVETQELYTLSIKKIVIQSKVDASLKIRWVKPDIRDQSVGILSYQVLIYCRHSTKKIDYELDYDTILANTHNPACRRYVQTNFTFCEVKNLAKGQKYSVRVRVKTNNGWGAYTVPLNITAGQDLEVHLPPYGSNVSVTSQERTNRILSIIIASFMGVVLVGCSFTAIIFLLRFKYKNRKNISLEKPLTDFDILPYTRITNKAECATSYVDPSTYEDPNEAVKEFTKEMDPSWISIESVIGGGEFGDVCRGKVHIPGNPIEIVAIKTLKPGATDKNKLDFLSEASIMGQFNDMNVISLKGVVTKTSPIMILTEYMENGSLDRFLRQNDGNFTILQLLGILRGIASGMRYLSEIGYIHRDLAARNILVDSSLVCKVSDFGLSREIESDDTDGAYTTQGGKIPVRWTAPEAIHFHKFTSSSDVWSYGILMWEVLSYGERPYWSWSNQQVIQALEAGYRLPPPMECPNSIHLLMLQCWQHQRYARPKFREIVSALETLLRTPELIQSSRLGQTFPPTPGASTMCVSISSSSMRRSQGSQALPVLQPPTGKIKTMPRSLSCNRTIDTHLKLSHEINQRAESAHQLIQSAPVQSPIQPLLTHLSSVDDWLLSIKMERYTELFYRHGITTIDYVTRLTLEDLMNMGVKLVGHQKKIMNSIEALRVHLHSMQMAEGFLV